MTPPSRHQFLSSVKANIPLCRDHYRLILWLPDFPPSRAGQFIQIACRDVEDPACHEEEPKSGGHHSPKVTDFEFAAPVPMLRRPFSLAGRRQTSDGVELHIIHRVVGMGTAWLSKLAPGHPVDILGPLGNGFTPPPPGGSAIMIGGGVGIPPMLYLASALDCPAVAFAGALSRDLLPLTITGEASRESLQPGMHVQEFSQYGIGAILATDDGSCGFRGFVTQALQRYLEESKPSAASVIYACGPEPMLKRVAAIAAEAGLESQIAVERAMACGMGTCQSCCIRVKKTDPAKPPLPGKDWCYRLACTDGPVFKGDQLLW